MANTVKHARFLDWAARHAAVEKPPNRCHFCGARIGPTRETCRFCDDLPALDSVEVQYETGSPIFPEVA